MRNFFQGTDAELAAGAATFVTVVTSGTAAGYGLLAADLTAFTAANTAYQAAYAAAINPATRTSSVIRGKDDARTNLVRIARAVALKINGTPSVTDQQKMDVGIKPRAIPVPIPAPSVKPVLEIVKVDGHQITILARQADKSKRGRPPGTYGMLVYSHVGETAPNDINAWKAEGNTTRTKAIVEFPATLAPFTKVWLTCCWISPRLQAGPGATPISINLGTFMVQTVDASGAMKLAA